MPATTTRSLALTFTLASLAASLACGAPAIEGDTDETGSDGGSSESADEVGESGSATATTTTTATTNAGDGSTDTDPTTDDGSCPVGSEGCPCTGGGGCDPGLVCEGDVCQPAGSDTTSTSDSDTSDTSTSDTSTSDTTDTGGGVCDVAPGDSACTACLKDACCSEYEACLGDEDCGCVSDCVANGGQQFQCFMQCGVMGFSPTIQDYLGCTQQQCGQDC